MNDGHIIDEHDWPLGLNRLYPQGRYVYFEGDDPDAFAAEMLTLGIDVRKPIENPEDWNLRPDLRWGELIPSREGDEGEPMPYYCFIIPPGRVEEIYGSDRWPLGT